MTALIAALQYLRDRLHARAYDEARTGHRESARVLWVLVDELDHLITSTSRKGQPAMSETPFPFVDAGPVPPEHAAGQPADQDPTVDTVPEDDTVETAPQEADQ